jgi:hypothetical protein
MIESLRRMPARQRREEIERRKRVRAIVPNLRRTLALYKREPSVRHFIAVKELFASLTRAHVNAPFD